jgi:hypothetical protein
VFKVIVEVHIMCITLNAVPACDVKEYFSREICIGVMMSNIFAISSSLTKKKLGSQLALQQ